MRRAAFFALLIGVGCNKSSSSIERAGAKVDASITPRGRLDSPGNDPAVVALARAALACPASSSGAAFDGDCAAFREWNTTKLFVGAPGQDPTLVNMLEDADARVRFLGARGLSRSEGYRVSRPLAERILAAARNETSHETLVLLAPTLSHVDVEKTGIAQALISFVRAQKVPEVRHGAFSHLVVSNAKSRAIFTFVLEMLVDPDEKVRFSIVDQLTFGGAGTDAEVCGAWLSRLDDESGEVGGRAARNLGTSKQCMPSQDKLLDGVERRIAAGLVPTGYVESVHRLCDQDKATPAAKARGGVLARNVASNKLNVSIARAAALSAVERCEGETGKAFCRGFVGDGDKTVAKVARGIVALRGE